VGDETGAKLAPAGDNAQDALGNAGRVGSIGEKERVKDGFGAGSTTTAQPAASAGASFVAVRDCGTFHGTIAATTPTGRRHTVAVRANSPSRASSEGALRMRSA
jgi:hypothetical protein